MDFATFLASQSSNQPPAEVSGPLAALWWAKRGDWDRAHGIVQDDGSREAAWVHAYLHRVEGDEGNAGYWYRRAKEPECTSSSEAEWEDIARYLCEGRVSAAKSQEFCAEIIETMRTQFRISHGEATRRLHALWDGRDLTHLPVILFHETPEYWANQMYFGPDSSWWICGEERTRQNLPPLKPWPLPE